MNQCTFVGRLTRDPEIRYAQDGQMPIARFVLAVDRIVKKDGEPAADFFPCVAFERRAEFVEKHLRQGLRIALSGKMRNDNYTNKNGEKVYGNSLYIDQIEFADGKPDMQQEENASSSQDKEAGNVSQKGSQPARTGSAQGGSRPATSGTSQRPNQTSGTGRTGVSGTSPRNQAGAASRQTGARTTGGTSRSAASGRSASARGASSYNDGFMNIATGIEEELPFK